MGDSRYPDLKSTLSSISVKALNCRTRLLLAYHLDSTDPLPSEKGFARDYRGLAEQIGFLYHDIRVLEQHENRTKRILESWEIREGATLDNLISYLENMERHDIIEEIIPSLMENVETYLEFLQSLENADEIGEDTVDLYSKENHLIFDQNSTTGGPKAICSPRRIYIFLIILVIAIIIITITIMVMNRRKAQEQLAKQQFNDITSLFKSSFNNQPTFKPTFNDQPNFSPNLNDQPNFSPNLNNQPNFKPSWKFE